jgi:UDP-glucose 4-epimerase
MITSKNILITGGAGYIGSQVAKRIEKAGYRPIIFDDLSTGDRRAALNHGFIQGSLSDPKALDALFSQYNILAVMHFAASIDVGESVKDPAKYYLNNVAGSLNLFEAMRSHHVNILIFSSTAAIFGHPSQKKIKENHPKEPINPYGASKLMVEKILQDYDAAYGMKSSCLRYFNAAGGDPEGLIKNYKKKENNLIPLVLRSLKYKQHPITIYGTNYPTPDGTCIRDYIHIEDLAEAHLLAMEKLLQGAQSANYNLGNGNGFSVKEVIEAAERTTGLKAHVIEGARREGDPAILIANSAKAKKELGWSPKLSSLETMLETAWRAFPSS